MIRATRTGVAANRTSAVAMRTLAVAVAVVAGGFGCADNERGANALRFGDEETLEHFTRVGTAPMFAAMPDGRDVIAWVSAPDSSSNARLYISVGGAAPAEIRDALGPIEAHAEAPPKVVASDDGVLHAIYVVGKEVPGRRFPLAALRYVHSSDGGVSWSAARTVTDDSEFGSHNFHALAAGRDGRVVISWLDGRHGPSSSSAYVATSRDHGATWTRNVRVDTTAACPCCRTALAVAPDGTIALAWRSILPGSIRDIVVARSTDDGRTWSQPVRVHHDNWQFNGCPHAGPSLRFDDAGRVHIAWWTGKDSAAGVWYARSDDGARTFAPAVAIDVSDFSRPSHPQLVVRNDSVTVVWDDGTRAVPRVLVRRSHDAGNSFGAALLLSDSTQSGSFPVATLTSSGLAVAWTSQSTASHAEHLAGQPDMKDPAAVKKLARVGDARIVVRREVLH